MMPRLRLLALMSLAIPLLVGGIWVPALTALGVFSAVGLFLFALVDLALSPSPAKIDVRREVGEVLSVGAKNPVRLLLRNRNTSEVFLDVHD